MGSETSAGTVAVYALFAVVVALSAFAAYLAWRGRVFARAAREPAVSLGDETRDYLTEMATLLRGEHATSPVLGTPAFDEAGYRGFLARLDGLKPAPGSRYHAQHVAYRDAVALYAECRRRTAEGFSHAAAHVSRASGRRVVDCASAAKARETMLTYGPGVDARLQGLLERCESERAAYYAMQDRLEGWTVAIHMLRAHR